MSLSKEQIEIIKTWMPNIFSIGDLQTKVNETFGTHLTYLETRFLLDDYSLVLAQKAQPTPSEPTPTAPAPEEASPAGVQVSIDPVTRPGCVVNGSVTFSDGQSATWQLDSFGRLGLKPSQQGYRPPQEDIAEFQKELQKKMSEHSKRNAFGL